MKKLKLIVVLFLLPLMTSCSLFFDNRENKEAMKKAWVDIKSYEKMNEYYWKDKNNVYTIQWHRAWGIQVINTKVFDHLDHYTYRKIDWADRDSFQIYTWVFTVDGSVLVYNSFAVDNLSVFYNWNKIDWVKSKWFSIINYDFIKDKNNIYTKICSKNMYGYKKNDVFDSNSFSILGYNKVDSFNEYYIRDVNGVYYRKKDNWSCINIDQTILKLEWVDSASFEYIQKWYAKDKNFVMYKWQILSDLDGNSFKYVSDWYIKDKNFVFRVQYGEDSLLNPIKIDFLDPKTFSALDYGYVKDKNWVYYGTQKIEGINQDEVKIVTDDFIKDSNTVQYKLKNRDWHLSFKALKEADAETFENIVNSSFFKDKNHIYYFYDNGVQIITWLDTDDIKLLSCYIKDNNNVFYIHKGKLIHIDWADAQSFVNDDNDRGLCYAKDKNHKYNGSTIIK